jgi:hypothetical protein
MATTREIVLDYVAAWVETDEGKRRALLAKSWTEDGTYTDPTVEVVGREALVKQIGAIHKQFAGNRIVLTSRVDEHHGRLRFTWAMVNPEGNRVTEGIDFGEIGSDGRLMRITGFFGQPSPIPH